jgi:CRP-like cAMP-binding protein
VLTREGAPGAEFFVLVAGEVTVTRRGRTLNRLGAGAAFGEIALLDLGPRTATIVATEPSDLLVFNRAEFASLLGIAPRAGNELMRQAVVHVRRLDPDETKAPADRRTTALTRAG